MFFASVNFNISETVANVIRRERYRTGKLLINQLFEKNGYIKKEIEEILNKYAEENYSKVINEYEKSQKSFLRKVIGILKG